MPHIEPIGKISSVVRLVCIRNYLKKYYQMTKSEIVEAMVKLLAYDFKYKLSLQFTRTD